MDELAFLLSEYCILGSDLCPEDRLVVRNDDDCGQLAFRTGSFDQSEERMATPDRRLLDHAASGRLPYTTTPRASRASCDWHFQLLPPLELRAMGELSSPSACI